MPTNAMGRDPQRPGNNGGNIGGRGSNADKDRAAYGGMVRGTTDLAGERQRLRALGATTITPKYGWDQAQISDFGITGGLMNAFKGVMAGNTYDGRMPQGLQGGYAADPAQRALQAPGLLGQPGQNPFNPIQYNAVVRGGLYGGGTNTAKLQQLAQGGPVAPQPMPQQPQAPAPTPLTPQTYGPKSLSTPGLLPYGVNTPAYRYF